MEKVTTATGKFFLCDYFNSFSPAQQVNIRIVAAPVSAVATVFGNKAETVQLWYGDQYLAGYTKLVAIVPESDAIRVVLQKE